MTYQEYRRIEATHIMLIVGREVISTRPIDWFGKEYDADIVIMWREDEKLKWRGFKIVGTENPWLAFHAVERYCATFEDITELHMVHAELKGYGKR